MTIVETTLTIKEFLASAGSRCALLDDAEVLSIGS